MSLPVPETKSPLLPSEGYADGRVTRHVYTATREVILPSPDGDAYEYMYTCQETGVERRWGTADRRVYSWENN